MIEFEPYYAVIFTSNLTNEDLENYNRIGDQLADLAKEQPGYVGFETARSGLGISVSYWKTLEDIKNWKNVSEHFVAQQEGRNTWYKNYTVRICKVEREYSFSK